MGISINFYKISLLQPWRVLVLIQVVSLRSTRQAHARKKIHLVGKLKMEWFINYKWWLNVGITLLKLVLIPHILYATICFCYQYCLYRYEFLFKTSFS